MQAFSPLASHGRVLLVEDDPGTSTWIGSLIAQDTKLLLSGCCSSVREAMHWLAHREPDFALVDLGLPDGSGLEVIRALVARHPSCEVLVLSIFGDERNVLAAIDAGAGGYLLKDGDLGSFGDHLACLRDGGSPLSPRIARTLIQRHRRAHADQGAAAAAHTASAATQSLAPAAGASPLSERELEVLTGVAKGFSYDEVALLLGITTNTVRTHIRKLYDKLSVNSRGEAVYEYNRLMREQGRAPLQ